MRKTFKNIAALGMAAAMVTGALTGCGSNRSSGSRRYNSSSGSSGRES